MSAARKLKLGLVPISEVPLDKIKPSPENDRLYKPVDAADPDIVGLGDSIALHGVKEPLVITQDGYIISGHRRYAGAKLAGLTTVPCRVEPFRRLDDPDRFLRLLREYNRQREKSFDEKVREEIISANPEDAYQSLIAYRRESAQVKVEILEIVGTKRRAAITLAKKPMLDAILLGLEELRDFWPVSDRRIHYWLLNEPPLRHARKPESIYENTLSSYKSLVDLLTRARLNGSIPWEAIADDTRPVTVWNVWPSTTDFIRHELDQFLKGYWRALQRSQPNHIEIIGEKSTLAGTLRPVAMEYCIPLTLGRGYCSLPPRYDIFKRFQRSGKENLILLLLSDFDPDGEEIAHSFARSMRDDFGVRSIQPVRVALTAEQVREYKLPKVMTAKSSSVHARKFHKKHGANVWESEALEPNQLQRILREAIDSVLDIAAFNKELEAEKLDAANLEALRQTLQKMITKLITESFSMGSE